MTVVDIQIAALTTIRAIHQIAVSAAQAVTPTEEVMSIEVVTSIAADIRTTAQVAIRAQAEMALAITAKAAVAAASPDKIETRGGASVPPLSFLHLSRMGSRESEAMSDDPNPDRKLKDLFPPNPHPPGTVLNPTRYKKRRRRKGELNDGEWAPGVKPKPKRE